MTILFPIIYSAALTYLVWKAFKVMSNGWGVSRTDAKHFYKSNLNQKTDNPLKHTVKMKQKLMKL